MEEEPESQDFNNIDPVEVDPEKDSIEQPDPGDIPDIDINNEETDDTADKHKTTEPGILNLNEIDNPMDQPERKPLSEEDLQRINKYKKFKKVDGSAYRRVNQFLRKHTYITAREWAIARLCSDFTTRGGAEMTFIGENLPNLVPFMIDTYTPQAVNQARSSFKRKVRKSGATFFYGALCGFFTADELDDILFESSEIARFLLEIEGTAVDIDDEIDIEDRITEVMRSVAEAASMLRTGNSPNSDNSEKRDRKISLDEPEDDDEEYPDDINE
ncbi:hypothetical protein Mpet_1867 [Methanolacinia petrolearia DSM 11571]|uniref:Uncharacterized protein n=1 Tax=Methanolacinia petrolearia (strain DSM 11571 / OCM 486 / SEBR 4847) TaxID=679926 RepID=E1RIM7_METP4|nr:DUF5806 family protein [Methanolacinia petrolearia]ADN36619.1 hypothetical protein Mpet_1867 [Methanolacinia petrolearia DSM 11571]